MTDAALLIGHLQLLKSLHERQSHLLIGLGASALVELKTLGAKHKDMMWITAFMDAALVATAVVIYERFGQLPCKTHVDWFLLGFAATTVAVTLLTILLTETSKRSVLAVIDQLDVSEQQQGAHYGDDPYSVRAPPTGRKLDILSLRRRYLIAIWLLLVPACVAALAIFILGHVWVLGTPNSLDPSTGCTPDLRESAMYLLLAVWARVVFAIFLRWLTGRCAGRSRIKGDDL